MTPEQFAYWLQGYAEIGGPTPTPEQWQIIKDHLALVFNKVTPNRTAAPPQVPGTTWPPLGRPPYQIGDPIAYQQMVTC